MYQKNFRKVVPGKADCNDERSLHVADACRETARRNLRLRLLAHGVDLDFEFGGQPHVLGDLEAVVG